MTGSLHPSQARLLVLGILLAAVTGCGGSGPTFAEVEGVVKFKGKPLANVVVEFLPDPEKGTTGPKSSGYTNDEGRFTLRADTGQSGAVVGWHRVVLVDPNEERPPQGQAPKKAARLPAIFLQSDTTPFRRQVAAGTNTFELDLSKAQ
jgi:hypothetical protein